MADDKRRLDPAGPLRSPQQTMTDMAELRLVQYRRRSTQYKTDSNTLTAATAKPAES